MIKEYLFQPRQGTWTRFMDMHSGGGCKTDYDYIYIEGTEDEAIGVFKGMFDQDPCDTACSTCGKNFSIDEYSDLKEATAYERNCMWDGVRKEYVEQPANTYRKYNTLQEYIKKSNVLVVPTTEDGKIFIKNIMKEGK